EALGLVAIQRVEVERLENAEQRGAAPGLMADDKRVTVRQQLARGAVQKDQSEFLVQPDQRVRTRFTPVLRRRNLDGLRVFEGGWVVHRRGQGSIGQGIGQSAEIRNLHPVLRG